MKKSIIITLILLSASWMLKAQTYSGGSGTEGDPFQIATKADLKYLSDNDTHYDGYYFKQTADIYFEASDFQSGGDFYYSGSGFLPIGGGSGATRRQFKSSYDGNNKVIDGIYMNRSEDDAGFFGEIMELQQTVEPWAILHIPTIENVTLTNVNITNSGSLTGGLVGQFFQGTISNCFVSGSVTGTKVGGLVGQSEGGTTIQESKNSATVSGTNSVGGLIGYAGDKVIRCYNTGNVSGQGDVGGFVGTVGRDAAIYDCYSKGDVNRTSGATSTNIGGFAGRVVYDYMMETGGLVYNCYSLGNVNYINASNPTNKGFSGSTTGEFSSNYFDSDVSNQSSATGATAKTTTQMKTQSTFTGWDFTNIWEIIGGNGANYPTLRDNPEQSEVTTPTTQASSLVFSSVQTNQITVSWTSGDGTNRVVFAKQANTGTTSPVDNTTYTANTSFGSGTEIATGWYCVYNGSGTSVTVTNLTAETDYIFQVFEYNGGAGEELYLTATATDNPKSQATAAPPSEPTTQATDVVFSGVQGSQMTVDWTDGNGSSRVVFAKQATSGTTAPVDNTTYTANTAFGSGTEIATGWYCVYNGSSSSVTVSGLTANTTYIFQVFEYNGDSGEENYLTTTATNNPKPRLTLNNNKTSYTYTGAVQTWTVPDGITEVLVKAWGAGGAGGTYGGDGDGGGSGGYATATLTVTPGQELKIVVGGGGLHGISNGNGGLGGWPGGGYGTRGDASGGGGGGYSGVFLSSHDHANALIIAGAGGGGTGYRIGGAGGGNTGNNGGSPGGNGGTQSAGGTGTNGADGAALQGGNGDAGGLRESGTLDGGGGGGGYYGGEGGYSDANGGGGGSGFLHPTLASGDFTNGQDGQSTAGGSAPNNSDEDYIAGVGNGSNNAADAGNGLIVISYSLPTSPAALTWTGTVNTDWNTAANWDLNAVPVASTDVTINNVVNAPVITTGTDASCYNLTVATGASLTINSGGSLINNGTDLTINGTLDMDGGTLTLNGTLSYGSSSILTYSNSAAAQTTTTNELPASGCVNLIINNTNGVTLNDATSISGDLTVNSGTFTIGDNNFTTSGATDINGALSIGTATYDANDSFDAAGGNITFSGAGTLKLGGTVTSLGTFTSGTGTVVYDGADQTVLSGSGLSYNTVRLEGSGTKTISDALIATTFDPTNAAYNVELVGDGTTITNAVDFQNTGTLTLGDATSDEFSFEGGISIAETGPSTVSLQGTLQTSNAKAEGDIVLRRTTIAGDATINSFSNGIDIYDNLVINDGVTLTVEGNRTPPYMAIYFHNTINSASGGTGNLTLNSDYFVKLAENVGSTDALGTLTLTKGYVEWTSPDISLETLQINQGTFGTTNPSGNLDVKDVIISSGTTFKGPNSSGSVNVSGNWTNNGTFTHNNGAVMFDGSSPSTITGATAFYDLTIDNSIGVGLYDNYDNTTVENTLTLTHGVVILGEYDLTLGENATVSGTPSASNMIVTNGSGVLKKEYSSAGSFTFPVGDISGDWEYTPATLNFQSGTFNSGWVSVKVTQGKQLNIPGTTNYIKRYWTVTESGITDFSCNTEFQYMSSDVVGDEAKMFGAQYDGSDWTKFTAVNSTDDQINCNGVTGFSDFTARAFPLTWTGTVSTDWNTAANWDLNAVPVASTDVTINNVVNAPVITTSTDASCYDLTVATGASLTINSGGSLITNGSITNNGSIQNQLTLSDGEYHIISPPNNNSLSGMFAGDYLLKWNEPDESWAYITALDEALVPAKGYFLWGMEKTTTHTFNGTPNTGDQQIALSALGSGSMQGFNLVGNPYPSSIDWSLLDDTYGAVYYWDPDSESYLSWNNGSGTGSQYIAPMQGFFVYTDAPATLSLQNSVRTHTGANNFYKADGLHKSSNGLILAASDGHREDLLHLRFDENATAGFDLANDAWKLFTLKEGVSQLYSVSPNGPLSIDVRPFEAVVPLGFANSQSGVYRIGLKDAGELESVVLEDLKENTFTDLLSGDYAFSWDETEDEQRFVLHLSLMDVADMAAVETVSIFAHDNRLYLQSLSGQQNGILTVLDLAGHQLLSRKLSLNGTNSIALNLASGVYLVRFSHENSVSVKKVFIQ